MANGPAETRQEILPAPPGPRALTAIAEPRRQEPAASYPSLGKALADARDRCRAAHKDARNTHHGYHYASADEVIATANEALAGSGLAIVPTSEEMTVVGSGQAAFYALDRVLLLTHESGEACPMRVKGWPVVPDRGKPLDKAYAIALTTSLAYKLRDLLQMPRGEQHDVAAQDDRKTPVPPPAAESSARAERPATEQAGATDEQKDAIDALQRELGIPHAAFAAGLARHFGVNDPSTLTGPQADQLIARLRARKAGAAPAG